MAGLKLKNIYKRYAGGVTAVTDFNLDILDLTSTKENAVVW